MGRVTFPRKPDLEGPSFGGAKTGDGWVDVVGVAREPSGGDEQVDAVRAVADRDGSVSGGDASMSDILNGDLIGPSSGVGGLLPLAEGGIG